MKVGVSLYSYARLLRRGSMTVERAVESAAGSGVDGIEMLDRYWMPEAKTPYVDVPPPGNDQVRSLRKFVTDAGLELFCYTVHNDFGSEDPTVVRKHVERVKRHINVGSLLGVRVMRVESSYGPGEAGEGKMDLAALERRVVEAGGEVAEYALKVGIRLGLENHGRALGSYHQMGSIIKAVNSPAYGANIDLGNFMLVDEDPLEATRALAKYATSVHAKDFRLFKGNSPPGEGWMRSNGGRWMQGTVVGEGDVAVKECLRALRQAGYDGALNIEHEAPGDPVVGVTSSAANLRRMLQEIG